MDAGLCLAKGGVVTLSVARDGNVRKKKIRWLYFCLSLKKSLLSVSFGSMLFLVSLWSSCLTF